MSNDVNRISAALLNPAEWKPSEKKLGFVLQDFTEQLHVKRWKYVIKNLEQLFPDLHQSALIRRNSRYRIIASKLFGKFLACIGRFLGFSFR